MTQPSIEQERRNTAGGGEVALARELLANFASVGARRFDLTVTDAPGAKVG